MYVASVRQTTMSVSKRTAGAPNGGASSRRDSLGIDELLDDAESCVAGPKVIGDDGNVARKSSAPAGSSGSSAYGSMAGPESRSNSQQEPKSADSRRRLSLSTESAINSILGASLDVPSATDIIAKAQDQALRRTKSSMGPAGASAAGSLQRAKCQDPMLGGSFVSRGVSTLTQKRACSNLRCTSCDFPVSQFQDLEWCEPVEYLFLRTHMPNLARLREKMRPKRGATAYGCQCSSFSATDPVRLTGTDAKLKWVCGKHETGPSPREDDDDDWP